MAISPDGKRLYVSDQNRQLVAEGPTAMRMTQGRIITFDAATGAIANNAVFDLEAKDVMPIEQKIRPWNVATTLVAHAGGLAVSPDGKRLAVINGYRVYIFDCASGKRLAELAGHVSAPQCVVFDRDNENLFTAGGDDGCVKQWDLAHPLPDRITLPGGQASDGRGIAISHDSQQFATAEEDGGIAIYDMASRRRRATLPPIATAVPHDKLSAADAIYPLRNNLKEAYGAGYRASDLRFTPDGKRLVAVYYDRLICTWDLSNEKPKLIDFVDELALEPNQGYRLFTHLLLSPDGRYLASESYRGQDQYYRVWEIEKRRLIIAHEKDVFLGLKPRMLFSADSAIFYLERGTPKAQPPVLAWDLATGNAVNSDGVVHLLASTDQVSPDGTRQIRIVEGVIDIEDRATGRTLIEYAGAERYFWAIFSSDGKYILACKDKGVELFDATPVETAAEKQ
jgi:WD40 repeat protein